MTVLYASNFDALADGLPTGWVVGTGAGHSVFTATAAGSTAVSGTKALFGNSDGDVSYYTASGVLTNQEQVSVMRIATVSSGTFRSENHVLRSNGLAGANAREYRIHVQSNGTGIRIAVNNYDGANNIIASSGYDLIPGPTEDVFLRSKMVGTTIECWLWKGVWADMPGTPTITVTNSTRADGYPGIRHGDAFAYSFVDNHVITDGAGGHDYFYGSDVTVPTLSSAAVANATPTVVNLTMSEAMDTGFVPAASAFTVTGHTVSSVAITGSTINLTCSAAFVFGEAARTVSYTQPGTNDARDSAGNLLANFSTQAITNNVAATDTTKPAFSSAQVANAAPSNIVITMSETLAAFTPATSAFTVSGGKTVSSVARSGATVTLTCSAPYVNGDTITVTYTKPGSNQLRDAAGNETDTFGPSSVTNNVAAVGGATITYAVAGKNIMGGKRLGVAHYATIHHKTTRALIATETGLTSDATTGLVSFTNASLVSGTEYMVMPISDADVEDTGFFFVTAT